MTNMHDPLESFDDIEQMVWGARNYVQPSADLRPRVLEVAKAQSLSHRAQRSIRFLSIAIFVLALLTTSNRQGQELAAIQPPAAFAVERSLTVPAEMVRQTGDIGWDTVEAFTEFRRRQAEALRLAL